MLGSSSSAFDACIMQIVNLIKPRHILELGCGRGKFGVLLGHCGQRPERLAAVQKMFTESDRQHLRTQGYHEVIDRDILEYYREGFDETYDLIVALDVIEHFLLSDAVSIINFSLYRADYLLLVWPSEHPQSGITHPFDRHRASFGLKELADKFDMVFYAQTGFAQMHFLHRYHIALLRGFMNAKVLPPFLS